MAYSALNTEEVIRDVKIGTLYRKETESLVGVLEYVFDYVLPRKLQLENLRFTLTHVKVDGKDLLSKEVLSTLSQVVTIIDLASEDEKGVALSSLLHVPIMKVDAIEDNTAHKLAMSIRPSYHVASQALFDVMDEFNFSRVAVVYDACRTREASYFYAKARRWPRFNIEMIPELILSDKKTVKRLSN
ncbi:hypothetical protein OS493_000893 [Desmophyllum pertusum]|uniref:Uncharacterized protein n=1 Tax=Desmophyllum pertusum TaxID=174260 RepID=A0A9W9ZTH8_9CNID|nr:hypothetical protein OS493_000893 [Desmophyllum pertusum]